MELTLVLVRSLWLIPSDSYRCRKPRAARSWADAVGGTGWRGWPGPLQAAWLKQEARRRWGRTGRRREPPALQCNKADLQNGQFQEEN